MQLDLAAAKEFFLLDLGSLKLSYKVPSLREHALSASLSLVSNVPEWSLIGIPHLKGMPTIRWKLTNLERLLRENKSKFAEQSAALREHVGLAEGK